MSYVFANEKVQKAAQLPINFENWLAFRQALIESAAELPACYDLPLFPDPQDFELEFGLFVANKFGRERSAVSKVLGAAFLGAMLSTGFLTILDLIEIDPRIILK